MSTVAAAYTDTGCTDNSDIPTRIDMSEDRTFSTKEAPAGYTDNSDIPTILPSPDDVGVSGGNCSISVSRRSQTSIGLIGALELSFQWKCNCCSMRNFFFCNDHKATWIPEVSSFILCLTASSLTSADQSSSPQSSSSSYTHRKVLEDIRLSTMRF